MSIRGKIALTLGGILLVVLAHTATLDQRGLTVTEAGLKRALVTFAVSRGLNGVISVVQGTEIAVEPVGIGMTFTPGQILDPVNDLIERFSTVVLVAGTAFGVQRIALETVAAQAFSLILTACICAALLVLWLGVGAHGWLANALFKLCLCLAIVRFAVPVFAVSGELFYQHFLAQQFATSSQQLQLTSEQLSALQAQTQPAAEAADDSLFQSAKKIYQSATASLDFQRHIERFETAAETISEHAIRLIVVFIFQTLVLPLLSIWLLLKALRAVLAVKF